MNSKIPWITNLLSPPLILTHRLSSFVKEKTVNLLLVPHQRPQKSKVEDQMHKKKTVEAAAKQQAISSSSLLMKNCCNWKNYSEHDTITEDDFYAVLLILLMFNMRESQ